MEPNDPVRSVELNWDISEKHELCERILNLRNEQIKKLIENVGLAWNDQDALTLVSDIRECEHSSIHLDLLITQAETKEELLNWISEFENKNFVVDADLEL